MKWKKVLSGVLTCALVMTAAMPAMPVSASVQGQGGASRSDENLQVASLDYAAPMEGEIAKPVEAMVDGHYDVIADRSEQPAGLDAEFMDNIALYAPVYVSGIEGEEFEGSKAVDGLDDNSHRWSGAPM